MVQPLSILSKDHLAVTGRAVRVQTEWGKVNSCTGLQNRCPVCHYSLSAQWIKHLAIYIVCPETSAVIKNELKDVIQAFEFFGEFIVWGFASRV